MYAGSKQKANGHGTPIGVFAGSNTNCIQFIDPETFTVSNAYLKGTLGTYGGGLFDVVITPDGKTAVVSNFGDSKIFFIDISKGFAVAPTILKAVRIPFFAEDMDITPDGKYLLVTDGGFSARITVVDIAGRTVLNTYNLRNNYANAVTIAPCGLVLLADYFAGKIHAYVIDGSGILTYSVSYGILPCRPVNIAVSPDGQTAIIVDASRSTACIFTIVPTCKNLIFKGFIPLPARSGQSCVFSKDGKKAYYLSNSQNKGTLVIELEVHNPGEVSATGTTIPVTPKRGTSQLFGVDNMALDPSGDYLYVTNPTLSGGITGVSVIDLTAGGQVDLLPAIGIPTGIAFGTIDDE
jgi:DNA-binding beta-propeller fold protein YncE